MTCIFQEEEGKNIKEYLIPPSSFELTKICVCVFLNNHHIIKSIQQNTVSAKKDFTLQLKKYGPSWQTSPSTKSPGTWKFPIPLFFEFSLSFHQSPF